jgi:hypothetical protein
VAVGARPTNFKEGIKMNAHNKGLFLMNELLRDGHNTNTLPLPASKLQELEAGETFTRPELAALQQAYDSSCGIKPLPK